MTDMDKKNKAKHGRHAAVRDEDQIEKPAAAAAPEPPEGAGASSATTAAFPAAASVAIPADAPGFVAYPAKPLDMGGEKAARKHKVGKVLGIVLGVIVGLLAIAYVAGAVVFMGRFWPHATMGDIDISFKTAAETQVLLEDAVADYGVSVSGQGFALKLTSEEAGLAVDGAKITDGVLASMNPWAWPFEVLRDHDMGGALAATYNESGLSAAVRTAVDEFNATATPPTNATIAYDEKKRSFIVQPESVGTKLDVDAVIAAIDEAVVAFAPQVTLEKNQLAQPAVLSTDAQLTQAAATANAMLLVNVNFTLAGSPAATLDANVVSGWIRFGENSAVTLDEAALAAWATQTAAACSTLESQRTYTRPDGKQVTVEGGSYGWVVDGDALVALVHDAANADQTGTVEMPTTQTAQTFTGVGARDWGNRYVDIDLSEQYARFYDESGAVIWETSIITGKPDGSHDTPTGVYVLNSKASPQKLIGYENGVKIYESHVTYWMPFVGNAIGMHDADWQTSGFGGTMYANGYGSHGCVNLPPYMAAELYYLIEVDDVVITHW